jgi:hypothetical protein
MRRPVIELDDASLDEGQAAELRRLVGVVRAIPAEKLPPMPDEMTHTVEVEDAGQSFALRVQDRNMTDEFRTLLDHVRSHASKPFR